MGWLAVGIYLWRREAGQPSKYNDLCQKDLADGKAQIITFSAIEAIQVAEFEDEGNSYFVHLSDGRVLFLSGQWLDAVEGDKTFPCTEFEVAQAPRSQIVFGMVCRGSYFPPTKEIKSVQADQFQGGEIPELEFVKIPWNEVEMSYANRSIAAK